MPFLLTSVIPKEADSYTCWLMAMTCFFSTSSPEMRSSRPAAYRYWPTGSPATRPGWAWTYTSQGSSAGASPEATRSKAPRAKSSSAPRRSGVSGSRTGLPRASPWAGRISSNSPAMWPVSISRTSWMLVR